MTTALASRPSVPRILKPKTNGSIVNLSRRGKRRGALLSYDNTLDAFDVQLWAQESLAILIENMVMGLLVHRDFDSVIASYGDTVNVRKPGAFKGIRKTNADSVTVQNANATNIPVKLNQQVHVSYLIKDGEESISFTSIIDEFLRPAMIANAQFIDHVLSNQVYQFLNNSAGQLGQLSGTNARQMLLNVRQTMNDNKAWVNDRNGVLNSAAESIYLSVEDFTDANRVGDDGTALRTASLGQKFGFDLLMAQNMPQINTQPVVIGAVNHTAGYSAGATSFTVDGLSAAITAGTWMTIAGDMTPLQVVSTTGGATPTAIVVNSGTSYPVVDDAVITLYPVGTVSAEYDYDATTNLGYAKELTISGISTAPQIGQLVTFGTDYSTRYGIIDVDGMTGVTLDRPLDATVTSGETINFGPTGGYNFFFHPNALTLVTRPMAIPRQGTGALAAVVDFMGLSIRVVITYDGNQQGHLVTLDILAGTKILDNNLGAVLLS